MFEYRMCFRQHFQNSWPILIPLIIFLALPFFMVLKYGMRDIDEFIELAVVGFLIFFVPQLLLHLNYYFINRYTRVKYIPSEEKLLITQRGKTDSFGFDEIKVLKRYKSFPMAENRIEWFPWDSYNYSIVLLKDQRQFIITSLLVPNMDLPLEQSKINLRKTFYPFVINPR